MKFACVLFHADWLATKEPTMVEPEAVSEGPPKSPSWTPSYSTSVQGSSPRFESQAVLENDPEPFPSDPRASGDPPTPAQDAESVPAPAEPATAMEVPEPTANEDAKPSEVPPIDAPSDVVKPSLGQTRPAEMETEGPKSSWTPSYTVTTLPGSDSSPRVALKPEVDETPAVEAEDVRPVEKIEGAETPKIVTHADEEISEPVTTMETPLVQSYSVTSQPGSPRDSPKAELEEPEPEPQPTEPVQETHVAAPIVELANVPETVVTLAVQDEDAHVSEPVPEEESKPAWAQSYSVTSQPGSPRVSPRQVPDEVPEVEEETSWTQSYSVTSQPGSPRILPKEDLPEPTAEPINEPITVVTPPVEEVTPAPVEAEAPERPKSPWTPSYSVTTLEGQTEQAPPEDTEPGPEVAPIPKTFVGEVPGQTPEADAPVTDAPPSKPLIVEDERPERPKSPWTPSYSVTTLPGAAPAEEPVASEPSVEVSAPEPAEPAKAVEDQPKENGTTSDVFEVHEAVAQLVHDEPQVDVEVSEPTPVQPDPVSFACLCQMIRSTLTVIPSLNRTLPLRLRRRPPGLLRTRSRNFPAQVRRWRRGKRSQLLRTFQPWTGPPPGRSNLRHSQFPRRSLKTLGVPPMPHTHKVPLPTAPRWRRIKTMNRITSPMCPSPWTRPQRSKPFVSHVHCLVVVLTRKT